MSKTLSLAGLGLLAACLAFASPSVGHAQGYRSHGGHGDYSPGYGSGNYGGYGGYSGYNYSRPGYGGYGDYGHSHGRPAVVHPHYEHWTPGRGYHSHGHLHVPHRGHSHTRPY
jgi:hypothetical protein